MKGTFIILETAIAICNNRVYIKNRTLYNITKTIASEEFPSRYKYTNQFHEKRLKRYVILLETIVSYKNA